MIVLFGVGTLMLTSCATLSSRVISSDLLKRSRLRNPGTSIQLILRTYSNERNKRTHQHLIISSGVREYLAMLLLQMCCIY